MSSLSIARTLGCVEGLALGKASVGELEGAVGAPTGELPQAATANAAKSASASASAFMLLERVPSDHGYTSCDRSLSAQQGPGTLIAGPRISKIDRSLSRTIASSQYGRSR
jgi:hypothetical protein